MAPADTADRTGGSEPPGPSAPDDRPAVPGWSAPTGPPAGTAAPPRPTGDRRARRRRRAGLALVAVVVAAAGLLAARAMARGPVTGNDSVTYLAVAGNIAAGRGVTSPFALELTGLSPREALDRQGAEPLTAWPPLYPLALAAGHPLGRDAGAAATGLNVVAAAATAALTAAVARRRGLPWGGAGLVAAVVVANPATVLVFATAGSESLFVPLALAALLLLIRATTGPTGDAPTPGRLGGRAGTVAALVAFAGLAGAAALTRYAGLALVLTGAVVLARWGPARRRRTRAAVAAATTLAAAVLPAVVLAAARTQPGWRAGPTPGRPDASLLAAAGAGWLLPERNRLVALAVVAATAGLAGLAAAAASRRRHPAGAATRTAGPPAADGSPPPDLAGDNATAADHFAGATPSGHLTAADPPTGHFTAATRTADLATGRPAEPDAAPRRPPAAVAAKRTGTVALVYVTAYVAVVGAGAALVDHAIPLGPRLALPLLPVAAVLVGGWMADGVRRLPSPAARAAGAAAAVAAAVAVVGLQLGAAAQDQAARDAVVSWMDRPRPPSLAAVAALPEDVAVFSNQPSSTYARTGRPTLALPLRRSPATGAPNPRAGPDEDELVGLLRAGRAVVVVERLAAYFAADAPTMATADELAARVPLEVLAEDDEYVVLRPATAGPGADPRR
jgi:hypothetical protein